MPDFSVFSLIGQGAALGLAAAASPGPFQTFLINQSLQGGWRKGAPVAFSPLISDPPIILIILFLLGQAPTSFLGLISLAGGLFALYMGWSLWRNWRDEAQVELEQTGVGRSGNIEASLNSEQTSVVESETMASGDSLPEMFRENRKALGRGALMNFLSPGPYMFWTLVAGPILLAALQQSILDGVAFLLAFYGLFIGGMLALVVVFHQARRLGRRVVRVLILVSIVIMLFFGGALIARGIWSHSSFNGLRRLEKFQLSLW